MIRKALIFSAIFIMAMKSNAQPSSGTINGNVIDDNGEAIEFANAILLSLDSTLIKGTITDDKGIFVFKNVSDGKYLLAASMVGYNQSYSQPLIIARNSPNHATTLTLVEGILLNDVVIASTKPLFEKQADRTVINVENSIVSAGSDAWEILQKAPGVEIDNNDQISVLGKQGTIVMIDGRRTFLTGEELANLLRSTPSSNIDKIEVITSPSAKYDASGNAGIINIINKKNIVTGFSANLSLNTGAGWNFFYNPATNFNYRTKRFNVFGNYSFADRRVSRELGLNRLIKNETQNVLFDQRNDIETSSIEHLFALGVDYYINDNNTIGISFRGFDKDDEESGLSQSDIFDTNDDDQFLGVRNISAGFLENYSANINYKTKINSSGSELTIDVNKIKYNISDHEFFGVSLDNTTANTTISQQDLRNLKDSKVDIETYQVDYSHPFTKKVALDFGVKLSDVGTENNIQFDSLINGSWINDQSKTNNFNYDETVYAGYSSLSYLLGENYKIQGGLRIEHTESLGNSLTLNEQTKRNYTDAFPSLSVTYIISKQQNVSVSYSRRIDRPRYQWLNPFIFFFDPFTFYQGNPLLRPQYTNNFEASYTKGEVTVSAGYTETEDAMSFVTFQVDSTLTGVATNVNLDKFFNYNLTLSFQKQVTNWWSTFTFFSTFYNFYDSQYEGEDVDVGIVSYKLNTNNSFSLPSKFKGEISAFYQAPTVFGISVTEPFYVINVGLQRSFMNKKLNSKLVFNDLLNSSKRRGGTDHKNQDLDFFFRRKNSRVTLSLSYSLGKSGIQPRKRKSGAATENNRVVTDN